MRSRLIRPPSGILAPQDGQTGPEEALQALARTLAQERVNAFLVAMHGLGSLLDEAGQGNPDARKAVSTFRHHLERLLD